MKKHRLDKLLVANGQVGTRSQAESYIKLGMVKVNGQTVAKTGALVDEGADIKLDQADRYISRGALKLESAARDLGLDFSGKTVLDVGSSTGGFTDYVLKHGAAKVIAVDVGSGQMHPSLRADPRLELHEKTDIRDFPKAQKKVDIVVVDVSFISLQKILPAVAELVAPPARIVAMVKPQFEADGQMLNKGVIKNDAMRRRVLGNFENWAKGLFIIEDKADSKIAGAKGNVERFYLLKLTKNKL